LFVKILGARVDRGGDAVDPRRIPAGYHSDVGTIGAVPPIVQPFLGD
jgi:hypothetical protein